MCCANGSVDLRSAAVGTGSSLGSGAAVNKKECSRARPCSIAFCEALEQEIED